MSERGVERKCRSEACGRWSFFPVDDPAKACTFCGAEYGKPTLGLDVFVEKAKAVRRGRRQTTAMPVAAPKPGEFGGGRR